MPTVLRLRCPGCGTPRTLDAFQLDAEDPPYELLLGFNHIGGRGRCTWEWEALPLDVAKKLRRRLRRILKKLDEEIAEADPDPDPDHAEDPAA